MTNLRKLANFFSYLNVEDLLESSSTEAKVVIVKPGGRVETFSLFHYKTKLIIVNLCRKKLKRLLIWHSSTRIFRKSCRILWEEPSAKNSRNIVTMRQIQFWKSQEPMIWPYFWIKFWFMRRLLCVHSGWIMSEVRLMCEILHNWMSRKSRQWPW